MQSKGNRVARDRGIYSSADCITLVLYLALVIGFANAQAEEVEFHQIEGGGAAIRCSGELSETARDLHSWVVNRIQTIDLNPIAAVRTMEARKEGTTAWISNELQLDAPSAAIRHFIDLAIEQAENLLLRMPPPNHFHLWTDEGLQTYFAAGGTLPGYEYTPNEGFSIFIEIERDYVSEIPTHWIPILVDPIDGLSALETAQKRINRYIEGFEGVSRQFVHLSVSLLASISINMDYGLVDPNNQWFAHGVGVHLALKYLDHLDEHELASELREAFALDAYTNEERRYVRLLEWTSDNTPRIPGLNAGQNQNAHMAFAYHEIQRLLNSHGEDVLARIFTALKERGEPLDRPADFPPDAFYPDRIRTMDDVFTAIQHTTGEDMRTRLMREYD